MSNKSNMNRDLFVMDFVQFVSAPQTHAKRVRKIKKTMETCPTNLTETQWMKMWRGFYYAIWYSEMRKGGEELIEEMGSYQNESYLLSGFKSLAEDWNGIDAFRIDKYMFLMRHLLRNVIKQQIAALLEDKVLFENSPFLSEIKKAASSTSKSSDQTNGTTTTLERKSLVIDYIVTVASGSVGYFLHLCDIYMDELERCINELVEKDTDKSEVYYHMMIPFARKLSTITDERLRRSILKMFNQLFTEILLTASISMRVDTVSKFCDPLVEIASHTDSGKNRNCLYSLAERVRSQVQTLTSSQKDEKKALKRKVVGIDRKTKKVKYEVATTVPFVRSLVPLPLM
ncbi:Ribosomal RNA processing protein 1 B [Tyrophagus putrescentiae]|nr:Ribosomal RNA processing protein 1 B [Tyrophagus putrescentiae]